MASTPWLKLYSSAADDAKLRAISTDAHFVWFQMLCLANRSTSRGRVTWKTDRLLAIDIGTTLETLTSSLTELQEMELIIWNDCEVIFERFFDYQKTDEELEALSNKRKEAGKRGAKARWDAK